MDVAEFRMSVTFRPSNEEEACEYSIHESTSPYILYFPQNCFHNSTTDAVYRRSNSWNSVKTNVDHRALSLFESGLNFPNTGTIDLYVPTIG